MLCSGYQESSTALMSHTMLDLREAGGGAKFLVVEADGSAAAAVGEDVAALEAFGLFGGYGFRHGSPFMFWCKDFERKEIDCCS